MKTPTFDFSDAIFVLRETRARETEQVNTIAESIDWDLDWLISDCLGVGWDRAPMVRSQGHIAVGGERGFSASGSIFNGRGVGRDAKFSVEPVR